MAETSSPGPLYFWRETDPETGWLSQWYDCPFKDDKDPNKTYKTAEHYMMHHKALLFNDPAIALEVLKAGHPRQVKALGRKVKNFDEAKWEAHRREIVRRGNILKFTNAVSEVGYYKSTKPQGKQPKHKALPIEGSLKEMLLATGDREIVEASPYDSIWGIGFTEANAEVAKESWGLNLLGLELMEVRKILRDQHQTEEKSENSVKGDDPAPKKSKVEKAEGEEAKEDSQAVRNPQ